MGNAAEMPANQPGVSCRVDRHEPAHDEHSHAQPGEHPSPHTGVDAIDEIVEKVMQFHGVTIEPANLEAPLHDVAPAEHHLLLVITQPRTPLRDKPLDDGAPVRESVLQREVVDNQHSRALVQAAAAIGGLDQQHAQPPREPRTPGEAHQLALQVPGPGDQIVDRDVASRGGIDGCRGLHGCHPGTLPAAAQTQPDRSTACHMDEDLQSAQAVGPAEELASPRALMTTHLRLRLGLAPHRGPRPAPSLPPDGTPDGHYGPNPRLPAARRCRA